MQKPLLSRKETSGFMDTLALASCFNPILAYRIDSAPHRIEKQRASVRWSMPPVADALSIRSLNEIQRWLIFLYPFLKKVIRPLVCAKQAHDPVLFAAVPMQHYLLQKILS